MDDEAVGEGGGCGLGPGARGVSDEGAVARVDLLDGLDLAVRVEDVLEVLDADLGRDAPDVEGHDGEVLGGRQRRHVAGPLEHLVRDGVVGAVVAVLDVLLRELPSLGHLVAVGALGAALALPAHEEAADLGPVALVVGRRALKLHEEVVGALGAVVGAIPRGLRLLEGVLLVHLAHGVVLVLDAERLVADLHRQVVLEVQQADLADVLLLGDLLADDCFLVARLGARAPPEHRVGAPRDVALAAKLDLISRREGREGHTGRSVARLPAAPFLSFPSFPFLFPSFPFPIPFLPFPFLSFPFLFLPFPFFPSFPFLSFIPFLCPFLHSFLSFLLSFVLSFPFPFPSFPFRPSFSSFPSFPFQCIRENDERMM